MIYYVAGLLYSSELYHHGIKNQKWGRRRFQYEDGSLTPAGRDRYGYESERKMKVAKAAESDVLRLKSSSDRSSIVNSKKESDNTSSSTDVTKSSSTNQGSAKESDNKDGIVNKINSMRSKLKDKNTSKELDYIIGKLKSGAYSSEDALSAAKSAVDMDAERAKYLASKKKKSSKKSSKESSKKNIKEKEESEQLMKEAEEDKDDTKKLIEEVKNISGLFEPATLSIINKALSKMETIGEFDVDDKTIKTIEDYVVKVSENTTLKDLLKKINEKKMGTFANIKL